MKFGRRIKDSLYSEWADYYIAYGALKKQIKANLPWNDRAEADFLKTLNEQLEKCEKFQASKSEELMRKINALDKEVRELVEQLKEEEEAAAEGLTSRGDSRRNSSEQIPPPDGDLERNPRRRVHYRDDDAGSDDDDPEIDDGESDDLMSEDEIEEKFRELEEEVATLVADVHDLSLFTKLNFTGFIKIVKKHDKITGYAMKETFNKEYLENHPFYRINYDHLIVKLSKLFDLVRTRGHPVEGDSSAGGSQNAFVRSTTKYWVHEDNIVPLKLAIMKHLPVMVFNATKEFNISDSAITSIYYDNEELDLYLGRLEKTEGAEAIRMRWYGDYDDTNQTPIFVERKTHREDWTGEKSVKERFAIKEDKLNAFCAGHYTMDAEFDALVAKGKKTAKDVEIMKNLANEIQYSIVTRKLRPVMRSFYNRTAFQLPGNASVRISLDTELTLIREDNFDGNDRTNGNWRRTDIKIDHPFNQVKDSDKELFPYGILEVKLATKVGEEPPEWIRDLIDSHLVEAVPKFSKFIHGCATLLPERVDLVPFWLPQMDQDIRKPVSARSRVLIERPHSNPQSSASTSETPVLLTPSRSVAAYQEPVSEGEDDEEYFNQAARNEDQHLRLPPDAAAQARAARDFREQKLRDEAVANAPKADGSSSQYDSKDKVSPVSPDADGDHGYLKPPKFSRRKSSEPKVYDRSLNIDPLAPSKKFDNNVSLLNAKSLKKLNQAVAEREEREHDELDYGTMGRTRPTNGHGLEDDEDLSLADDGTEENRVLYVDSFRAPPGKRIAIPIRIEPKVVFAAERTFLKWSHFAVLLSGVSIGLLNFTSADDRVGIISAYCFTFTALLTIAYCGAMYAFRILKLRKRMAIDYHDKYGPAVLVVVLIASVLVNLTMRIRELMSTST